MKQQILALLIATSLTVVVEEAHAENLLQVYQQAKGYDAQLKALESNYLSILEKKPQALAALKPQVSASGSVAQSYQHYLYDSPYGKDGINSTNLNYSLNMQKSLYNKSIDAQVAQTDSIIAQASAGLEAGREDLVMRVAQAYFEFLAAQDNVQFARTEKEAIGRQLEQTKAYFDAGRSAITDVKEAESRYDLATSQEITTSNQLDLAREKLRLLTGNSYQLLNAPAGSTPLAMPNPSNIDQWVKTAQASNKQLQASKQAVATALKAVDIQRAAKKPVVSLYATHTGSNTEGDTPVDPRVLGLSAGVQVNMPLYTGGATDSKIREAQHDLRQAEQQLDLQARQTEQATRSAYLTVESSIAQVKASKQALVSAETAAEATQAGFEVGTRTSVDVLNSLRNVFSARRDYSQARYTYLVNTLKLKQAAGTLGERDVASMSNYLTATPKQTAASLSKMASASGEPIEDKASGDGDTTALNNNTSYDYYASPDKVAKDKAGAKTEAKTEAADTKPSAKTADKDKAETKNAKADKATSAKDKKAVEAENPAAPSDPTEAAPAPDTTAAPPVLTPHKPGRR